MRAASRPTSSGPGKPLHAHGRASRRARRAGRGRAPRQPAAEDWLGRSRCERPTNRPVGVLAVALVRSRVSVHRARSAAARLRRPACRRRAVARARDRGDAAAERRAGADQQRAGGARGGARHAGHLRRRRRQDPGDLRRTGRRHLVVDDSTGLVSFPYLDRARRAAPSRAEALGRASRAHVLETPASRC